MPGWSSTNDDYDWGTWHRLTLQRLVRFGAFVTESSPPSVGGRHLKEPTTWSKGVGYFSCCEVNTKTCHNVSMVSDRSLAGPFSVSSWNLQLLRREPASYGCRPMSSCGSVTRFDTTFWSPTRVMANTNLLVPQLVDRQLYHWRIRHRGRQVFNWPITLINDFVFSLLPSNPFTNLDFSVLIIVIIVVPNVFLSKYRIINWLIFNCFSTWNGSFYFTMSV